MNKFRILTTLAILVGVLAAPLPAGAAPAAQDGLTVSVAANATCAQAFFAISVEGGSAPYELTVDFGDGETLIVTGEGLPPTMLNHTYAVAGEYAWSVIAVSGLLSGQASGTLAIGPAVTLTSNPFPPLLPLVEGGAAIDLTAEVTGGTAPFTYAWSFEGAATSTSDPASPTASATYNTGGKFTAGVSVTDACGLMSEDTLTIVVDDPLAEGCHPTAEWIANAVNTLFPQQAEQLYTCEDIYGFFTGGLTGSQLGFGQMRHAYMMAQTIPDLTWEEILDWKLDGNGWGPLMQLDRVVEAVGEVGIAELIERVTSGENSAAEIRTAARMVVRYEADFSGALDLLAAGANNGELGQLYRAAAELGVDPAVVAGYREMGVRPVELEQAARVAERLGTDWASVLEAHAAGESWGAIRKGDSGAESGQGNGQGNGQGGGQQPDEPKRNEIQNEVNARVAAQLAAKYGLTAEQVLSTFTGACSEDWACVRTTLREQNSVHGTGKHK